MQPILEAKNLLKNFPLNRGILERKRHKFMPLGPFRSKLIKAKLLALWESRAVGNPHLQECW